MRNKTIKYMIIQVLMAVVMALSMPCTFLTAWASNAKIAFSDPNAVVGSEVTVTMKVTSTSGDTLDRADIMLSYDASALEFISGTNASGGAGSISVKPSADGGNGTEMVCTLRFTPLKAGTSKITVSTQEIYDSSGQLAELDRQGDSTITIGAQQGASGDAGLKSLQVSPGTLEPAFSTSVEEYTVQVGTDVSRLAVSAEANSAGAAISIEGDSDLQMGENIVTCQVTAEDGQSVKTYTIHVNKVEGGPSEAVTAVGGLTTVINGKQYTVETSFDMGNLPEGFEQVSYSYKGNDVMAAKGTEKDILLMYMTDEEGKGDFFIYNEGTDSWTPYMEISVSSKAIVILPLDKDVIIPDGFTEGFMNLENGRQASGWVPADEANPQYWLFYGMNWNGEKALYRYDLEENTIQRYFQNPIGSSGSVSTEQYQEVVEAGQALEHQYEIRGIIILILGIAILLLLGTVLILASKMRKAEKMQEADRHVSRARRRAAAETAVSHSSVPGEKAVSSQAGERIRQGQDIKLGKQVRREKAESEDTDRSFRPSGKKMSRSGQPLAGDGSNRAPLVMQSMMEERDTRTAVSEDDDSFIVIDLDLDDETSSQGGRSQENEDISTNKADRDDKDEDFEFIDLDKDE
ncbi:cadherin-like beta sandwich domain-containing protein [Lachnospiraceae bacterium 62-35]